jgi:integrase
MRLWLAGKELAFHSGEGGQADADRSEARRTAKRVTLGTYADQWIEQRITKDRHLKRRTQAEYRRLLDSPNGLAPLHDYRLDGITKKVVAEWFADVSQRVNPRTGKRLYTQAARAYGLLKAIMESAVNDDLVDSNPCAVRGASGLKTKVKGEVELLKPDELRTILEHLDEFYRLLVLIAALGGLRFGEATALTRADVNLEGRFPALRVNKGVTYVPGEGRRVESNKTDDTRTVFLPEALTDPLRNHLEAHADEGPDSLVFPSPSGSFLAESTMTKHWYPARAAAGRSDFPFHSLRHWAGTYFAQVPGVTKKEIMDRLGHRTDSASWLYQHSTGREAEQMDRLGELPAVRALF